jgi:hypothetical protein
MSLACVGITGKNALSLGGSPLVRPPSHSFGVAGRDAATGSLYNWIAFIAPNRFSY